MKQMTPREIEEKSFRIIGRRIPADLYTPEQLEIVRKVIHATADFSLRKKIHISPDAIDRAVRNLKKGMDIFVDVKMVEAGISPSFLTDYKGRVICHIRDAAIERVAKKEGITRSQAAVRRAVAKESGIGIYAIGNAPTALFEILKLAQEGRIRNAVVIGACVGMVGAAEAKAALIKSGIPCIALKGMRGGSPIAATIVNALFKIQTAKMQKRSK